MQDFFSICHRKKPLIFQKISGFSARKLCFRRPILVYIF